MPWTSTEPSLVISMRTDAADGVPVDDWWRCGSWSGAAWTGRSPAAAGRGFTYYHRVRRSLVVAACRSLAGAIGMAAPGNYPTTRARVRHGLVAHTIAVISTGAACNDPHTATSPG